MFHEQMIKSGKSLKASRTTTNFPYILEQTEMPHLQLKIGGKITFRLYLRAKA